MMKEERIETSKTTIFKAVSPNMTNHDDISYLLYLF